MLPRVASRSEVPYSALYGLFLDAVLYRHTYKADIGVGGMAYNPSYVELNFVVSYGSIPKQKSPFTLVRCWEYFFPCVSSFCTAVTKAGLWSMIGELV